jgi:uncharacterized protein (TIGR02147 family)
MDFFEYKNYRKLLSDWLRKRKSQRKGGVVQMAEAIGIHPTFLSQVLGDTKEFSAEQAMAAASYMSMTALEKEFFLLLVLSERAGSKDLKEYYNLKLEQITKQRLDLDKRFEGHKTLTDADRAVFYSSWIYSAIRLACSIDDGQTVEQLCLRFDLPREKVISILDFLCGVGFCENQKGKYLLKVIHTHVPSNSPFVVRHHINWRLQALQKIDSSTEEELHLTAPMMISKKDFTKIRDVLTATIKECVEVAKESKSEELACLNIDFFWPK